MITPENSGFINIWLTPAKNIGEVLNSEKSTNRSMRGNVVQFSIKMVTRYTPKTLIECLIASQWVLLKVIQRKCNSECPECTTDAKLVALQGNNPYCLGTNRIWACVWSGRKVQRAQYLQVKKWDNLYLSKNIVLYLQSQAQLLPKVESWYHVASRSQSFWLEKSESSRDSLISTKNIEYFRVSSEEKAIKKTWK